MNLFPHISLSNTLLILYRMCGDIDLFVTASEKAAANGNYPLHTVTPVEVTIKDNYALCESMCHIVARFKQNVAEWDIITECRFYQKLERVEEQWRLLTLEVLYVQDTIAPSAPNPAGTIEDLPLEGIEKFRPSYKYLAWRFAQMGVKVGDELAGTDNPESMREIVDRHYEWIASV